MLGQNLFRTFGRSSRVLPNALARSLSHATTTTTTTPSCSNVFVRPAAFFRLAGHNTRRNFSQEAPSKKPQQNFAQPGRPGPSRVEANVSRSNPAVYLAGALMVATVGFTGWLYQQKKGPFALIKTEEDVAAEEELAAKKLSEQLRRDPQRAKITHRVFFDISLNGKPYGRIVMGLFGTVAPKTVDNFVTLASDGIVVTTRSGKEKTLSYKNTIFHRVIPKFMIQGGDFVNFDGTGGYSKFGRSFPDENFDLWHVRPGILSMANAGPNTNSSQFFITTAATPWLDGKHVIFGMVTDGYNVVRQVERLGSRSGEPSRRIQIDDCGVLTQEEYDTWVAGQEEIKRQLQAEAEAA